MKRKHILIIVFAVVQFCFNNECYAQTSVKKLTTAEKLSDFEKLYSEFQSNYPYFGINKRLYNTDWLSNYKKYRRLVRETNNDEEFHEVITKILNDLHNDHTDTYPTSDYLYFYEAYKKYALEEPSVIPLLKELEKTDTAKTKYWTHLGNEILNERYNTDTLANNSPMQPDIPNVTSLFIDSISTSVIKIRSFSFDYLDDDVDEIKTFLSKIDDYENLIIDIQGNDGGTTEYWSDFIIPKLISDTLRYDLIYAFKDTPKLRAFKPSYFEATIQHKDIQLPELPDELSKGEYLFKKETEEIIPSKLGAGFDGKIYLLVDKEVFSSAEGLAVLFKATNLGTVAGEKTNGDGVGSDPLLLTLPNSGIVIRYTGEMGLNPDGSANDEAKTVPDLTIKANSEDERLKKLLDIIRHH